MMVEAFTRANYVKFFTDPYYTQIFCTTLQVAADLHGDLSGAGVPAGLRAGAHRRAATRTSCMMLVVLPLFVGNAVRAAGWMTLFGQGSSTSRLMELGIDRRAVADHVHREGGHHRHHRRQPAVHGPDAAKRTRRHRRATWRRRRSASAPGPWPCFAACSGRWRCRASSPARSSASSWA